MPTMNTLMKTTSIAALSLAAAGCATAPPMALKPQDIPAGYSAPVAKDAAVWPKADWWQGFGSPEMNGIIEDAQKDNLDLGAAAARVLEAEANQEIAGSSLFPSINLGGSASRQGSKATGHWTGTNSFGASLDATYQLDFWGEARDNLRAATEALKSARFAQETVALTVTTDAADTYLDVLALRQRDAIALANISAANRILKITEAKVDAGVSSRLDLAQQQAQVSGQEALVPAIEEQEREARYTLAVLLAHTPEGFDVKAENLDAIVTPKVGPGVPSELLRRRPDVAQAEANLAAAHANVDAARAAFFPSIDLTASGGYASTAFSALFHASSLGYSIGASLLQTIFDGGKLEGESKYARARQEELVDTYRKTVLGAFQDVETALGQVASLSEQEKYKTEEVNAAQEAFRISEIQYREGVADLLAVLQAQQTLFTAQDQLVQIKLARMQADIGLYRALGGGWSEDIADVTQQIPANTAAPTDTKKPM
jgi:outer membrane protein, multidrug efflux system